MNENFFGPSPKSPLYQEDCSSTAYVNPYFPAPAAKWYPQPAFWYAGDPCTPQFDWPVGDPDDYRFQTLSQPLSEKTLLEEMEIERPERYLPGEVYRNETPKTPIEDLSKTANCPKKWIPKDPRFHSEFRPSMEIMNPPLLLEGVLQRKAETVNSFAIPQKIIIKQSCDGVEDSETKEIRKPNYTEILKLADTRPADFKCEPDVKIEFHDACKNPDLNVHLPPAVMRNVMKSVGADIKLKGEKQL